MGKRSSKGNWLNAATTALVFATVWMASLGGHGSTVTAKTPPGCAQISLR
jgi:hypothetical protein